MMTEGRIVKALSGFYYVETAVSHIIECKARGKFRKEGLTPLVGDLVRISESGGKGVLEEILPRRNSFIRPAVSNLDALVILCSNVIPVTEPFLIDRVTAIAGNQNVPVILCVNKVDEDAEDCLTAIYRKAGYRTIRTSAVTCEGVEELLDVLEGFLPEGPQLFPEDMTSDQPERQMMAEILREKLLLCLDKEIPHGTAVEITRFSERDSGVVDVDAVIYCEKASHKGIIIGKGGEMLKKISSMARSDCEKFMGTKVYLTTWVKVKENWRDSDFLVRNFGYSE